MNFDSLVTQINETHILLHRNSVKAINISLTLRNWLIGCYILEFEQQGEDRAKYGTKIISELASRIEVKGLGETNLKLCRQFYLVYPTVFKNASQELKNSLPFQIRQSLTDEFHSFSFQSIEIGQSPTDEFATNPNQNDFSPSKDENNAYLNKLFLATSFTHFVELIKIDDATKRKFYELLILKTTPSVSELKRQINTLTFERLGLSENYELAYEQIQQKITPQEGQDIIKSHYFLEFLNLKHPQLVEESDLEQALIQHLQQFILELGNGFCFEARQKRILIGEEYYFIDLVFYHRILKCHVIVELKTDNVKYEHIGQLKTYINYFKKNIVEPTDNPPIGILLVTNQNKALVEYAVADSDNEIFVSKYLLQLPDKQKIVDFIENEIKNL